MDKHQFEVVYADGTRSTVEFKDFGSTEVGLWRIEGTVVDEH